MAYCMPSIPMLLLLGQRVTVQMANTVAALWSIVVEISNSTLEFLPQGISTTWSLTPTAQVLHFKRDLKLAQKGSNQAGRDYLGPWIPGGVVLLTAVSMHRPHLWRTVPSQPVGGRQPSQGMGVWF